MEPNLTTAKPAVLSAPVPELKRIQSPPDYPASPEAKALGAPPPTPQAQVQRLQDNHLSVDSINYLAHGLPPQQSVGWACKSSAGVEGKLPPADKKALGAAEEWSKNPTPAKQSAAASAAAATDYQSPAAWAAQGAAWAPAPGAPPPAPGAPNLTGQAVAGSVLLAAAWSQPEIPKATLPSPAPLPPGPPQIPPPPQIQSPYPPPLDRPKMAALHQPHIDTGLDIASGKTTVP